MAPEVYRPWRGRHYLYVPAEELDGIVDIQLREHPAGSEWEWGYGGVPGEGGVVRISADEGINLDEIAEEAGASARR